MCGIAGLVDLNGNDVSLFVLKQMTDAISHRGPDGEGQWVNKNIGLGHRRLSIIDITIAGNQPMISLDQRYIISFNGEIYNYKEIKNNLIRLGYKFISNSDTEVVLNALCQWGKDAFLKFNGMFSLAFYDKEKNILLLGRDRYGIKPLYYSFQNNSFAFGSEQKAITAQPGFVKNFNKKALLEYFTFQNIFTDQTFIKDIKLFPSGHFATLDLNKRNNSKLQFTKYWDYHFRDSSEFSSREECTEELSYLLRQSVNRQMISDVEIGTYLSGGIDSSSITSIVSEKIHNLKTFTCGFDLSSASGIELTFDEREKAKAMAKKFDTNHHEIVLKAGDLELAMHKLTYHLEEPRVGQSYPNFYAAKLASKYVKVVLSGSGGDELFGGYPWRYYRAANSQNFDDYIDSYYIYWQRLVDNKDLKKLFKPIWSDVNNVWTRDIFKDVFQNHNNKLNSPEDYINHSLYFEAKTFLQGLFIVEDKLSMAHGLENRVPFMDNDIVDFAMKCPIKFKLNNLGKVLNQDENIFGNKQNSYYQKTNDGKQILRDAMINFLPKDIVNSKKQGFSSPDASWFKGESIDFVKEKILNNNAKLHVFFDKKIIKNLLESHFAGKQNKRLLIWSLLSLEYYLSNV